MRSLPARLLRRPVCCALLLGALLCGAFGAASADACSVPVFRYALERWRPDTYEVLIYHRGELEAEPAALIERLNPEYEPGEPFPNTAVTPVDLTQEVRPEFAAIWEADAGELLPWIVLRTPWKGQNETVWKGPLTAESVETMLGSPLRAEIVRRLLGGDSIVWVLLRGADADRNAEVERLCREELPRLQREIALPSIREEDLRELSVDPDQLGLRFSLATLDRAAPEEAILVQSLLRVQTNLRDPALAGETLLFPVFGRGRAFFPLIGDDIDAEHLDELARFLCGACQCTVKQQNPGLDLLTAVDWDAHILGTLVDRPAPPLAGLGGFADAGAIAAAADNQPAARAPSRDAQPDASPAPPASVAGRPSTGASQSGGGGDAPGSGTILGSDSDPGSARDPGAANHRGRAPGSIDDVARQAAPPSSLSSTLLWTAAGLTMLVALLSLLGSTGRR